MNLLLHLILLVLSPLIVWLSVLRIWIIIPFLFSLSFKLKSFKALQSLPYYLLVFLSLSLFYSGDLSFSLISSIALVSDIWGYSSYIPILGFFSFISLPVLLEFQSIISRCFQFHVLNGFHHSHPLVQIVA